ncbi:putative disease resistance protein At1g50180 isoform X3 [Quercus robur]|uniref:putative disease resistance protein At1g50180 isoform X3 n=1 Tax=Quercus robur TaxID=38942 RepID=UPI0021617E07|nr:putative disease resistance protein At1g50180 isoform X3 [Quercus robur]
MAEAVVSSVVTRIGDLLVQEGKFLSGVSNQVELLKTELNLMQGLLKDADARQDESETVRRWVAEIRDLAYDADDIIATYALTVGSRKGGGVQKVLKRCSCIFDEGITVHQVGSKIEDIMTKISSLKTSFRDYGIRESMIKGGGSSSFNERKREERQTFSHLDHDVVGFDDDLNKLVEFLLKEGEGNRVASICGMDGLGKTTLAKMVYNHPEVKKHFEFRTWSYISQQCQRRRVWEEILIKLLSPTKEKMDEIQKLTDAEIVEKLREVQLQKKCLVIIDDIWDIETWNSLRDAFPLKYIGSKILLTSRNKQVSLHADTEGFLYELQTLNKERSWELLEKIAISRIKDCVTNTNKPNIEKIGKEMIEYCGGLPLAITVLGGLLATKQTLDEWEDVLKHIKSYIFKEDDLRVNKVLSLSYNDLPCHLKPCFLYLGHFPEDFEIPTEELIQMWMGEGFIPQISHEEDGEDTMEYEGEQYLRELMQRCMVQVGEISKLGRIKTCRIHDLMRDFCISKAQQENFLQITKKNIHSMEGSQWHIDKIRRLAITLESNDNYLKGIKFSEYPYLRSLLYFVRPKEFYFKKSKLLRVLNMKNYNGKNLPKDIGRFIHLRFLSLENSNINKVPSSLGNLRCLQTLDLRLKACRCRVPNILKKMEQLRHLYLPFIYWVSEKLELGNLYYLQTLLNVRPKTIKMPTSFRFNYLRILSIKDQNAHKFTGEAPHVIQILSSCPHIYKLVIYVQDLKKLPETRQFLLNLAELKLKYTGLEEDPMPTLEKLPNLKILHLLQNSFEGKDMDCSEGGFPLLQYLFLDHLYSLEEWRVEKGAMPNLCQLKINYCNSLKTIPDGLRFVTTLRELEITNMRESFKDMLDEGGLDFDKVKHVPSLVFQNCDW